MNKKNVALLVSCNPWAICGNFDQCSYWTETGLRLLQEWFSWDKSNQRKEPEKDRKRVKFTVIIGQEENRHYGKVSIGTIKEIYWKEFSKLFY